MRLLLHTARKQWQQQVKRLTKRGRRDKRQTRQTRQEAEVYDKSREASATPLSASASSLRRAQKPNACLQPLAWSRQQTGQLLRQSAAGAAAAETAQPARHEANTSHPLKTRSQHTLTTTKQPKRKPRTWTIWSGEVWWWTSGHAASVLGHCQVRELTTALLVREW